MIKKENLPPIKQGVFYQLNINKNSGPFLPKDIMHDNPKSNMLLTRIEAMSQHKKMGETLAVFKKPEQLQESDQSIQSFNTIVNSCQQELIISARTCKGLQISQYQFRREIEQIYNKISVINNQILETSLPVLKNLMKQIKESNQADKAEYYKINKELQRIEMEKRSLQYIFTSCENRIEEIEKYFGNASRQNQRQSMPSDSR